MPKALGEDGELHPDEQKSIDYEKRRNHSKKRVSKRNIKDKSWIQKKKEIARDRGDKVVARDSKYTGRKRKVRF